MNIKLLLEDLLFPIQCIKCGYWGKYVCDNCNKKFLDIRRSMQCHVCKRLAENCLVHKKCQKLTSLDGVLVCQNYSKLGLKVIEEYKYKSYSNISKFLVPVYIETLQKYPKVLKDAIFVPVPLYKKKQWARGYNQAEILARFVAKGIKQEMKLIINRSRQTRTQVGLSKSEREENLKEAFELSGEFIPPLSSVILVDDIMTTGTTLEECAQLLKSNGVKKVYAVVFMRG